MLQGYLAVGRRCAVSIPELSLPLPDDEVLARLRQKGFNQVEVKLPELAEFCVKNSIYRRGANISLAPGVVDCSSLTKWLYGQIGIWLPRHSLHQRESGQRVDGGRLEPWDLVFTRGRIPYFWRDPEDGVGHVGIVTRPGIVMHAASKNEGIVESSLAKFTAPPDFRGAVRILRPSIITLESLSGRRAECSWDYRCFILQTLAGPI